MSSNQLYRQHKDIYEHVIDTVNNNCHRINQVGFPFMSFMFMVYDFPF